MNETGLEGLEINQVNSRLDAPTATFIAPSKDVKKPRTAAFGELVVTEDLTRDLLLPAEREVYQQGIDTLRSLISHADAQDMRILTDPEVVSAIVGLQPLLSFANIQEAETVYRAFQKAGLDFQQHYSLLDWKRPALVNDLAATQILTGMRPKAGELGLAVPDQIQGKQELLAYIVDGLNGPTPQDHLLYGLLSGYPPEDCEWFMKREGATATKSLNKAAVIPDVEAYLHRIKNTELPHEYRRSGPSGFLDRVTSNFQPVINLERRILTKFRLDALMAHRAGEAGIKAFGLRWRTTFPPSSETTLFGQKLLQVDREFGLSPLVNKARGKFGLGPAFPTFGFITSARNMLGRITGGFSGIKK